MAIADIYQKATLVQIPSGYKSGTLYSVVPNTADGDFTVTGDPEGEATRVNKDGLIENVAADVPRLNYNFIDGVVQPDPHLLLEPTRTNSLPESENFSTNWIAVGSTVSSGISSPDGGTNAYSLIEGTATGGKIIYDTISVSAGSVTYSLFMKKSDKRYTALLLSGVVSTSMFNVDLENGTGTTATGSFDSTSIEEYPNGWYRISVTATATAGNLNCNVYLMNGATYNDRNYTGNGTDKTYIFGAQLEAGSYPTSYIPTSGTAAVVTRTADDAYQTTTFDLSTNEYSFYIDVEGTNFTSDFQYLLKIEDGSNGRGFRLQSYSFGGNEYIRMFANYDGGLLAAITPYGNTDIPFYDRNRIAVSLRSDGWSTYLNGVKLTNQSASTSISWDNVNKVDFNSTSSGSSVYGRKTYELMIFNEALSDAELQTLTS